MTLTLMKRSTYREAHEVTEVLVEDAVEFSKEEADKLKVLLLREDKHQHQVKPRS